MSGYNKWKELAGRTNRSSHTPKKKGEREIDASRRETRWHEEVTDTAGKNRSEFKAS